jgi:uncharacterized protein (DUF433 family)/antitoxin component of MazEF toxin-antitoxin module
MNTSTRSKIVKIGNSRGVRIPRALLEQARLEGDVEMSLQGDRLVIRSISPSDSATGEVLLDDRNVPMIAGTTLKVIQLVIEHLTYGWSPEELKYQHPYLSLGQVYSALAYYWNHQEEIEQEIERQSHAVEQLRRASLHSRARSTLKAQGML